MRNEPDASWHKQREDQILQHVERLMANPKFVIDTSLGQRGVLSVKQQSVQQSDRSVDLKRLMSQQRPDRALEAQMPVGRMLQTTFFVNKWWVFQKTIARLVAVVYSPVRQIIADQPCEPMTAGETRRALAAIPPPLPGVPTTVLLVSTSGFDAEARELAERTSERTILLLEPNASGGWTTFGSTEISGVADLLDPETEDLKNKRVDQAIEESRDELLTGSLSAEKLALMTQLPLMRVEDAVKSFAKRNPGMVAKRLDGRLLLFREGSAPQGKAVGGEGMTLVDRIKLLFNRKGDHEKKIAFLSERRAALTQQRDTSHDELFRLEKQESQLKQEFKTNEALTARKRITAQLVQLRKEIERRQQLLQVVNQQVNLVSTHLHNLELLNQGKASQLPSTDEIANDAAAAEEMLAQLQADSELADSVSSTATAGLSAEEQELYEELMKEMVPPAPAGNVSTAVSTSDTRTPAAAPKSSVPIDAPHPPAREPG